ncbi:2648_t:CDS:1, partial [Entrophospora sp. SA101]
NIININSENQKNDNESITYSSSPTTSLFSPTIISNQPFTKRQQLGGFSGSRRTLGISLNSPKRPFYHDNNSGSSISSID